MPLSDLEQVQHEAISQLREEDFKCAVENEKKRLKARKLHLLPKRIRLQWPVRLEEHYQPLNRRKSDKGRTL